MGSVTLFRKIRYSSNPSASTPWCCKEDAIIEDSRGVVFGWKQCVTQQPQNENTNNQRKTRDPYFPETTKNPSAFRAITNTPHHHTDWSQFRSRIQKTDEEDDDYDSPSLGGSSPLSPLTSCSHHRWPLIREARFLSPEMPNTRTHDQTTTMKEDKSSESVVSQLCDIFTRLNIKDKCRSIKRVVIKKDRSHRDRTINQNNKATLLSFLPSCRYLIDTFLRILIFFFILSLFCITFVGDFLPEPLNLVVDKLSEFYHNLYTTVLLPALLQGESLLNFILNSIIMKYVIPIEREEEPYDDVDVITSLIEEDIIGT